MGNAARSVSKGGQVPLHLKQWRRYRGLTQEALAERLGTTKATVSRVEAGKQNWDQAFLRASAEELGCSAGDLLMRDPSDPDGIWTIWEQLGPVQREQVVEIAKTLKRTGT